MTDPKDWPKNRQLWTTALRDPERKQTTGKLGHQDHGGQCCLGVLAEIAGCRHTHTVVIGSRRELWDGYSGEAPERARGFVGLRESDGAYVLTSLTGNNDRGKTLAEIADIIESEPEGLFREAI